MRKIRAWKRPGNWKEGKENNNKKRLRKVEKQRANKKQRQQPKSHMGCVCGGEEEKYEERRLHENKEKVNRKSASDKQTYIDKWERQENVAAQSAPVCCSSQSVSHDHHCDAFFHFPSHSFPSFVSMLFWPHKCLPFTSELENGGNDYKGFASQSARKIQYEQQFYTYLHASVLLSSLQLTHRKMCIELSGIYF